ncbi:MAG: hypothetical protein ACE15E_21615, partial [Acidobacteriota bacterium]
MQTDDFAVATQRDPTSIRGSIKSQDEHLVKGRVYHVRYRLPVAGCRLPVTRCQLPVTRCRLPVIGYQLPVTSYR